MTRRAFVLALSLLAAGCSVEQRGIEVPVSFTGDAETPLAELRLCISAVALEACEPTLSLLGARLGHWLLPSAHAHSASSALRIGVPHVLSAHDSEARLLGTFTPPPGDYCALKLSIGAADDDAEGVTEDMVGRSLRWTHDGERYESTFSLDARREITLPLPDVASSRGLRVRLDAAALSVEPHADREVYVTRVLQAVRDAVTVEVAE